MSLSDSSPALVFFDVDGTLLDEQKQIPASAVAAIRQLRKNGHKAFLNTGRTRAGLHPHILDVQFDGIIAGCGTWIEYQGQLLLNKTIDPEILGQILPVLESSSIDVWLEGPEHVYFESLTPHENVSEYINMFTELPGVLLDWHLAPIVANKLCFMLRPESRIEPGITFLLQHFTVISHQPEPFGEVILRGYSKATGMAFLLEHIRMPRENTFAFGDSLNDVDMLTFAQYGIAMGGSRNKVLRVSDHVTSSPAQDGIANALRHYGLI